MQTRDPGYFRCCAGNNRGPASAMHRHSASQTCVNALMALHRVRDTAVRNAGNAPRFPLSRLRERVANAAGVSRERASVSCELSPLPADCVGDSLPVGERGKRSTGPYPSFVTSN